jgi:hypothetical protein
MTAAVLAAALAASAAAAAPKDDGDLRSMPPKPPMWWDGWFQAPPAAPPPAAKKPDKPDGDKPPRGPSAAEVSDAVRKRELAAFLRRQEVCDRLIQVAVQNNDEDMRRQAEDLYSRAWELYQQRTRPGAGGTDVDPAVLDQQRLTGPAGGAGRLEGGRTQVYRGGKP